MLGSSGSYNLGWVHGVPAPGPGGEPVLNVVPEGDPSPNDPDDPGVPGDRGGIVPLGVVVLSLMEEYMDWIMDRLSEGNVLGVASSELTTYGVISVPGAGVWGI